MNDTPKQYTPDDLIRAHELANEYKRVRDRLRSWPSHRADARTNAQTIQNWGTTELLADVAQRVLVQRLGDIAGELDKIGIRVEGVMPVNPRIRRDGPGLATLLQRRAQVLALLSDHEDESLREELEAVELSLETLGVSLDDNDDNEGRL